MLIELHIWHPNFPKFFHHREILKKCINFGEFSGNFVILTKWKTLYFFSTLKTRLFKCMCGCCFVCLFEVYRRKSQYFYLEIQIIWKTNIIRTLKLWMIYYVNISTEYGRYWIYGRGTSHTKFAVIFKYLENFKLCPNRFLIKGPGRSHI